MKINLKIKQLRKELKITQTQLAKELGVTQVQICRWENQTFEPSYEQLMQLAIFFNVSADYLLGLVDERNNLNFSKGNK